MTIREIYDRYTPSSSGFCIAVSTYYVYDLSKTEIARIAERAATADEFERIWAEDDWWTDENNECHAFIT